MNENNKNVSVGDADLAVKIGARIKRLRKHKKMTQKQLAGDKITRNMLSRIENGFALPSLPTLTYIAGRLDVPCACLLDDATAIDHINAENVRAAHELMKRGEYGEAAKLVCSGDAAKDDEALLIAIECNLEEAKKLTSLHKYFDAYKKLTEAVEMTEHTLYSTAGSGYIADLYLELSKMLLPLSENDTTKRPPKFDNYIDLYVYIKLLDLFEKGQIVKAVNLAALCEINDRILSAHIAAKLDISSGRYAEATAKLRSIVESESASPTPHGGLMLYSVYSDLEQCAKGLNDYVSAYNYKEEKLRLFSAMSGIEL